MTLLLFLTHGAMFISLKTDGRIRAGPGRWPLRVGLGRRRRRGRLPALDPDRHGDVASAIAFVLAAAAWSAALGRDPRRPRGVGVPRHLRRDRARGRGVVPGPVPGRHADLAGRRGLPDDDERVGDPLHAQDHDRGGGDLHPGGARLPGLDLLGLPQADRRAPHPHHAVSPRSARSRPDEAVRPLAPSAAGARAAPAAGRPGGRRRLVRPGPRPGLGGGRPAPGGAARPRADHARRWCSPRCWWREGWSARSATSRRPAPRRSSGSSMRRQLVDSRRRAGPARPDRRGVGAGDPRGLGRRALPHPLPAGAGARLRAAAARRGRDRHARTC